MLPVSRQHVSLCLQQQTGNRLATILLAAKQHAEGNMLQGNMLPGVKAALDVSDLLQWLFTY